ncbi:MAG: hypothetical protein ACXACA_02655 [Candidatus Ranarchaeia archaeon]|jgi:hypothetical protein
MPEYLVLLKLNPVKLNEAVDALRNMHPEPVSGVNLLYSLNIFGSWDAGIWIKAEENSQALKFVNKNLKNLEGVTEVYALPTFPHANAVTVRKSKTEKTTLHVEEQIETQGYTS